MKKSMPMLSLALTLSLLLATVSSAAAAQPQSLHIEQDWIISEASADFVATGEAVQSGLVCDTGTATNLSNVSSGAAGGTLSILHVLKRFTCDDSSGTFDIALTVNLDLVTHDTTASWRIVGGTDSYSSLRGNGRLVGTHLIAGVSIHDVYDGMVH
jgi:hypothetical protein